MKAQILIFLLVGVVMGGEMLATPARIVSLSDRKDLLSFAKNYTNSDAQLDRSALKEVDDPFAVTHESVDILNEPGVSVEEVVATKGTPEDILRGIVEDLKPTGSLMYGSRRALMFGRKFLLEGDSMKAKFGGMEYVVKLISVSDKSYALQLDDFVLQLDFNKVSSGVIQRSAVERNKDE